MSSKGKSKGAANGHLSIFIPVSTSNNKYILSLLSDGFRIGFGVGSDAGVLVDLVACDGSTTRAVQGRR